MPVFAARSSGSPSSTARIRAAARCWRGPLELPNHASLVTLTSQSGRSSPIHDLAGEDRLVADQRAEWRQPRNMQCTGPGPEAKPLPGSTMIGNGSQSGMYSPNGTRCHLSYNAADHTAIQHREQAVAGLSLLIEPDAADQCWRAVRSPARLACRAGSSKSSRPGNAVSGQTATAGPAWCGPANRVPDNAGRFCTASAWSNFWPCAMLPCTSTTASACGGTVCCSRHTPTATHAASSPAPAARHRQPRIGRAASSSVARVRPCTPTMPRAG